MHLKLPEIPEFVTKIRFGKIPETEEGTLEAAKEIDRLLELYQAAGKHIGFLAADLATARCMLEAKLHHYRLTQITISDMKGSQAEPRFIGPAHDLNGNIIPSSVRSREESTNRE